jgi:hypothetical protein
LAQLNTTLAQATKDKEAAIAGAERAYDQSVAARDTQYGSESAGCDTGTAGAARRAAIATRDSQYYAARDTSWASTLSGSTTLGNSPWSVKAISAANAQAAYSSSRASAQAAHDAAMLDAVEDWQLSSRDSLTDLLFAEGQSRETFSVATANVYADWENGVGNLLAGKPEGTEWGGGSWLGDEDGKTDQSNGVIQPMASSMLLEFDEGQRSDDSESSDTESPKDIPNQLPKKKRKIEPGKPGHAMQELTDRMDEDMKRNPLNMINPMSHAFFPVFLCKCAYTGVFIESRLSIAAAHDEMRNSASKAAEESDSEYGRAAFGAIGYGLSVQETYLLAVNRFGEGGMVLAPIQTVGLAGVVTSPYMAVPTVGYGSYCYGSKVYDEGLTPENFGDGILLGTGLLQVSRRPTLTKLMMESEASTNTQIDELAILGSDAYDNEVSIIAKKLAAARNQQFFTDTCQILQHSDDSVLTIVAHGNRNEIRVGQSILGPSEIADLVRASRADVLELLACNSGSSSLLRLQPSLAQRVASQLEDVIVIGANGKVMKTSVAAGAPQVKQDGVLLPIGEGWVRARTWNIIHRLQLQRPRRP